MFDVPGRRAEDSWVFFFGRTRALALVLMFVLLSAPEYNLAWVGSLGTLCLLCLVNWGFWLHHAGVCSWWNLRIGGKPWRDHYSADLGRIYGKPPEKRLYYKIFYGLFRVGCLTPSFFLSLCYFESIFIHRNYVTIHVTLIALLLSYEFTWSLYYLFHNWFTSSHV